MKKKIFMLLFIILSIFLFIPMVNAKEDYSIGIITTNGSNLNVRTEATTTSSIKDSLKNKSYVTILNEKNSFYYLKYDNTKYGYAHKSYISKIYSTKKNVKTSGSTLNVRSGPSTSYYIKDTLYNNKEVYEISKTNGWSKIIYDGSKEGYVNSTYLSNGKNLNVVSYKQFDNRWANVVITNNKTMKQIGCLTTALAMTESYRTNTTITPLQMKNKSKYTLSGSIYWPSHYYFKTTSTNYLAFIKNKIDLGKPVLIGFKNNNGGQHWVVVTGYNNIGTKTSDFLINDPGSSYRTNLNQVISSYPKFYKLAYY